MFLNLFTSIENMFLRIGHRGAGGYAVENTLTSLRKALKCKVDMIEFDVQRCKTGELFLIHDKRVNRVTNGRGFVKNLTFEQIKALKSNGEKIPTLEEALKVIGQKKPVLIDTKGIGCSREVARLVKKYGLEKTALITSARKKELLKIRKLLPKTRIGLVTVGLSPFLFSKAVQNKIYSISLMRQFLRKALIEKSHKHGIKIFVYTYGSRRKLNEEKLEKLGVDGAYLNYP